MSHTLREDPCRRFTFGFTTDNGSMRIWYGSRADVFVSTAFDIMNVRVTSVFATSLPNCYHQDHKYLVHFFLALLYSETHELGWDPTVEHCPADYENDQNYYIYTVQSINDGGEEEVSQFKTLECLSDSGAEVLRGRGTRVWKVRRWENSQETGPVMVLKDCWMDSDREREGDTMEAILERAKGTKHEAVLRQALLTTVVHGDVRIKGAIDQTFGTEERQQFTRSDEWIIFHHTQRKHKIFDMICGTKEERAHRSARPAHWSHFDALNMEPELKPVAQSPKKHYRIVFQEVCTALQQEAHLINHLSVLVNLCHSLCFTFPNSGAH